MNHQNQDGEDTGLTQQGVVSSNVSQGERRPALVSLRGESLAVPIPLERDQVTLGRALEADVRVNDGR